MTIYNTKWGQEDIDKVELNDIFFSLKKLLERKTNIHWHTVYLEKYITENIVPFGLRLDLPSL